MASRPSISEVNRYHPNAQQKRRAHRGYIKGTRMTIKKPGDMVFGENGECFIVLPGGHMIRKER